MSPSPEDIAISLPTPSAQYAEPTQANPLLTFLAINAASPIDLVNALPALVIQVRNLAQSIPTSVLPATDHSRTTVYDGLTFQFVLVNSAAVVDTLLNANIDPLMSHKLTKMFSATPSSSRYYWLRRSMLPLPLPGYTLRHIDFIAFTLGNGLCPDSSAHH